MIDAGHRLTAALFATPALCTAVGRARSCSTGRLLALRVLERWRQRRLASPVRSRASPASLLRQGAWCHVRAGGYLQFRNTSLRCHPTREVLSRSRPQDRSSRGTRGRTTPPVIKTVHCRSHPARRGCRYRAPRAHGALARQAGRADRGTSFHREPTSRLNAVLGARRLSQCRPASAPGVNGCGGPARHHDGSQPGVRGAPRHTGQSGRPVAGCRRGCGDSGSNSVICPPAQPDAPPNRPTG